MASQIHLVSKKDVTKHATVSAMISLPPLAPSSVRVRSKLLGITSNNFTYALRGGILNWWDTYPIPRSLPAPHADAEWGIVPAWGYAEVLESTIDVPQGSLLWGFWPTGEHPVDLELRHGEGSNFTETSGHRKELMTLYNAYQLVEKLPTEELQGWTASCYPTWAAGYVLNRQVFAEDPARGVHPMGFGEWSAEEAELKSTVLVNLSATSKVGRSFAWNLAQRASGTGPLGLLQASASADSVPELPNANFANKAISYQDLSSSDLADWLAQLKPSRIIVLDCGGPAGSVDTFLRLASSTVPQSKFVLVAVGAEPKVTQPPSSTSEGPQPTFVQFNASGVIDAAIEAEGAENYQKGVLAAFQSWVSDTEGGGISLVWGQGVSGESGIDRNWDQMCNGTLPRHKAFVFKL